jgi:beta-glucosidase
MKVKLPFLHSIEMSGGDYVPLALNARDLAVIHAASKANPRCVVALVGGSVYTMEDWKNEVPAILMAWYFGMEGGHALARVLFGDVNPSGKMPLTIPSSQTRSSTVRTTAIRCSTRTRRNPHSRSATA